MVDKMRWGKVGEGWWSFGWTENPTYCLSLLKKPHHPLLFFNFFPFFFIFVLVFSFCFFICFILFLCFSISSLLWIIPSNLQKKSRHPHHRRLKHKLTEGCSCSLPGSPTKGIVLLWNSIFLTLYATWVGMDGDWELLPHVPFFLCLAMIVK